MSREIKFRAWDYTQGRYLEHIKNITNDMAGQFHHVDGEEITGSDTTLLYDDVEIEQYTGLKDKNGEEIYEGDIMRYDAIDYKVLWADYYAGFETKRLNSPWNNAGLTLHFLARVGTVIGNIHENPELVGDNG